jgi:hypothetical protein
VGRSVLGREGLRVVQGRDEVRVVFRIEQGTAGLRQRRAGQGRGQGRGQRRIGHRERQRARQGQVQGRAEGNTGRAGRRVLQGREGKAEDRVRQR